MRKGMNRLAKRSTKITTANKETINVTPSCPLLPESITEMHVQKCVAQQESTPLDIKY